MVGQLSPEIFVGLKGFGHHGHRYGRSPEYVMPSLKESGPNWGILVQLRMEDRKIGLESVNTGIGQNPAGVGFSPSGSGCVNILALNHLFIPPR